MSWSERVEINRVKLSKMFGVEFIMDNDNGYCSFIGDNEGLCVDDKNKDNYIRICRDDDCGGENNGIDENNLVMVICNEDCEVLYDCKLKI